MKKTFVLILITMFLFTVSPIYLIAETLNSNADTCMMAQTDAANDTNNMLWGGAGCMLSFLGIIIAYNVSPSVPMTRIMGKSSEYVMIYSGCYQEKAKQVQGGAAITGCIIISIIEIVYVVINYIIYANAATAAAAY